MGTGLRPLLRRLGVGGDVVLPDATDVFCRPEVRRDQVVGDSVYGTAHFAVYVARYPTTTGHLMIVPRDHIATMAQVPRARRDELEQLTAMVRQFQRDTYGLEAVAREQGSPDLRQTVHHAHLHLIPIPAVTGAIDIPTGRRVSGWAGVSLFHRIHGGYHYLAVNGERWVASDRGPGVDAAERVICDALGRDWDEARGQAVKPSLQQSTRMARDTARRFRLWVAPRLPERAGLDLAG